MKLHEVICTLHAIPLLQNCTFFKRGGKNNAFCFLLLFFLFFFLFFCFICYCYYCYFVLFCFFLLFCFCLFAFLFSYETLNHVLIGAEVD